MYIYKQSYQKKMQTHRSNRVVNIAKVVVITAVLFLTAHLFAAPSKVRIESLEIEQSSGKLRVNFDVSKSVKFKAFTLKSPNRVVIDFKNTTAAQRVFKFSASSASDPIKAIRHAVQDGKNLRVVLDMKTSVGVMSHLKKAKAGARVELILSNSSIGKKMKRTGESRAKKKSARHPKVKKTPSTVRSMSRSNDDFIVVIDPGHGGKDPGAIGFNGIYEKNVVLQIAKKLRAKIDRQPGIHAVMTRSGDKFIPLRERIRIASRSKADLFISIHANSNVRRSMSGSSVYILSRRGASSEAAHFIAARENAYHARTLSSIDFAGRNRMLKTVLLDLTKSSTITRSLNLAKNVLRELGDVNNLHRGRVESASFVVLKSLDIPSMLVETAYISNPKEEQQLTQNDYQNTLATAIFRGIKRYYTQYSPKARKYASSGGKYKVRSGDTLLGIARRHHVSLSQIKRANNLTSGNIRAGQTLKIPAL